MCANEDWRFVLDKFHQRKVRVRCPHRESGCDWVSKVKNLNEHANSCSKRPWECEYCAFKCTYEDGREDHWLTCRKYPEPCPNGCEVGSVERCNMEQHRSVCPLEPVACEMMEFGCSAMVARKDLAAHMRDREFEHLTSVVVLNLSLSRQLQQDSAERDTKIAQLQQEFTDHKRLQTEMQFEMQGDLKKKINELKRMQADMNMKLGEQKQMQAEMKTRILKEQKQMQTKLMEEQKKVQTKMTYEETKMLTD